MIQSHLCYRYTIRHSRTEGARKIGGGAEKFNGFHFKTRPAGHGSKGKVVPPVFLFVFLFPPQCFFAAGREKIRNINTNKSSHHFPSGRETWASAGGVNSKVLAESGERRELR